MLFKYCPHCGLELQTIQHDGDDRSYCSQCNQIHFRNPTVGVAVILVEDGRLLLVKRLGSYAGMWCIPCGHVEWGEEIRSAAQREFKEETGLDASIGRVFAVHSNFHDSQKQTVGIWFRAERVGGELKAGTDAEDARFFALDALPQKMAFPTDLLVCAELKQSLVKTIH